MARRVAPRASGTPESEEYRRILNQEDLLVEISERLQIEMRSAGLSPQQLSKQLGHGDHYVSGLIDGFANITVRELADVFSIFRKIVALNLHSEKNAAGIKENFYEKTIFCSDTPDFDRVTLKLESYESRTVTKIEYTLAPSRVINSVRVDESVLMLQPESLVKKRISIPKHLHPFDECEI